MFDFIAKYWIEFLLGIISSTAIAFWSYIKKLIKRDRQQRLDNQFDDLYKKIEASLDKRDKEFNEEDKNINNRIDAILTDLAIMKDGILSLHRRRFIDDCRKLLAKEDEITQEDYNRIKREHGTYKSLGGNHEGDEMYDLFLAKYKA